MLLIFYIFIKEDVDIVVIKTGLSSKNNSMNIVA
jgi:hypothetical protein